MTRSAVAVVLMFAPAFAVAQTPPVHPSAPPPIARSGPAMSIESVVDKALAESPTMRAAWARADAAKGELLQASQRANPEVMTERRDAFDGMNSQTAIGVSLPLELGRRKARVAVAIDGTAVAALAANEEARQVAARVRLAAIRALAADRALQIGVESFTAHQQLCDIVAARVAEGAAAPIERDVAEVELRLRMAELTRLRANAIGRWADLNASAGLPAGAQFTLKETLEEAVALVRSAAPGMADALDARPDVAAAQASAERADARAVLARQEGKLDLRLNATYMRTRTGFPLTVMTPSGSAAGVENGMNEFVLGATIMLPWRNRNQGAVAVATAEKKVAEHERDALLATAEAEVAAAASRDAEAVRALDIYTGGLLDLAARNRDVVRQSYQLGRGSRLDVLAEERRYREVQVAYVDALVEAYEARVMLTLAQGGVR